MEAATAPSPEEFEALRATLASMRDQRDEAQAEVAVVKAEHSEDRTLIAHLKLLIAKYKRETFGVSSERSTRLLDQLELQLEELEVSPTEDELAAEKAVRATTTVKAFARKKPSRQPFLEQLPRDRVHGDDTTVPVLAKGQTDIARLWTYVRDDAPFGGTAPPAAIFYYSRDSKGVHPQGHLKDWSSVLQAEAYGGYNELYKPERPPGLILGVGRWAHARRKFFVLARTSRPPSARRRVARNHRRSIPRISKLCT